MKAFSYFVKKILFSRPIFLQHLNDNNDKKSENKQTKINSKLSSTHYFSIATKFELYMVSVPTPFLMRNKIRWSNQLKINKVKKVMQT